MNIRLHLLLFALCGIGNLQIKSQVLEYVGTTPCGSLARTFLGIPRTNICDKISWRLSLSTNAYELTATWGTQAQSAPEFENGGASAKFSGKFETVSSARPTLKLIDAKTQRSISFARVSDNHLQLLAEDQSLAVGNEFWSYTLNKKGAGRDH